MSVVEHIILLVTGNERTPKKRRTWYLTLLMAEVHVLGMFGCL